MTLGLTPLRLKDANLFVGEWHRHNKPTIGGFWAIGVTHEGDLVGVAIVGRPVARMLDNGTTAEVLRVCVRDSAPKGSPSKLYAASWRAWRAMGGTRMVTYTLAKESGASLRGAGWTTVAEAQPKVKPWHGPDRQREFQSVYNELKLRWEPIAQVKGPGGDK